MHVLVTTIALVEDGSAFICTAQLPSVVADLFAATLFAWVLDDAGGLDLVVIDGLHFGSLCA
jgi:hypothetical protein